MATSSDKVISLRIFLDSVRFLVKFFKTKFHSKSPTTEAHEEYSSHSDNNEPVQRKVKKQLKVDDKLFYISVIQGLSYILSFKIPEIVSQDPSLLTKILKLILNNDLKAVLYNQGSMLTMLHNALRVNHVDQKYVRRLAKQAKTQKSFLRYKRDLYNRIKRKMPFGTPLFLNESGIFFENFHSHLPNNQIQESIISTLIPPENRKNSMGKYPIEEEKVQMNVNAKKKLNFEDQDLNAAMVSAFGSIKTKDYRKSVFGKLGRSLSVEYMHKQKAGIVAEVQRPPMKNFMKNIEITQVGDVMFSQNMIDQLDNLSEGYTSNKDTDAASIDLLDRSKPWSHIRRSKSRQGRKHKRHYKSNKNQC